MEHDHVLLGHIIIGSFQILTVVVQALLHRDNRKNIRKNEEVLQKIEITLKTNGYAKLLEQKES